MTSHSDPLKSLPIIGKLNIYDWALSIAEGEDIAVSTPEPILLPLGITARIEITKEDYENECHDKSAGTCFHFLKNVFKICKYKFF